jgi:hypothetical protein
MREDFARQGYVFLRGLLPLEEVASLRTRIEATLTGAGWLGDSGLPTALGARAAESLLGGRSIGREIFSLEELHRLVHHPVLLGAVGQLLGGEDVLRHPRPVSRVIFPSAMNDVLPTPPHQDHLGMQGSREACTAWISLGEIAIDDGPLALARGSHLDGLRSYRPLEGARVFPCEDSGLEKRWESAAFAPGDAVIFHSCTVHRAHENCGSSLRLSVDARYQLTSSEICEASLREDADCRWADIYRGWHSSDLAYYWTRGPLLTVPFDPARASAPVGDSYQSAGELKG